MHSKYQFYRKQGSTESFLKWHNHEEGKWWKSTWKMSILTTICLINEWKPTRAQGSWCSYEVLHLEDDFSLSDFEHHSGFPKRIWGMRLLMMWPFHLRKGSSLEYGGGLLDLSVARVRQRKDPLTPSVHACFLRPWALLVTNGCWDRIWGSHENR